MANTGPEYGRGFTANELSPLNERRRRFTLNVGNAQPATHTEFDEFVTLQKGAITSRAAR
jgi:hypothetical protein